MTTTQQDTDPRAASTPVARETTLPVITDPEAVGEWIAIHVFYSSNNHPLLVDGVGPVIEELRADGLLRSWFFIRYWMEGPHLRVRLLPRKAGDTHEVARRMFAALDAFLDDRPALYDIDEAEQADLFKEMFLGEYTEEQWEEMYGRDGSMPLRPNNTYQVMLYEPEIGRYGGDDGIVIAEWHFEKSSDLVLHLVEFTNVHVRSVLFGLAAQLMTVMLGVFQADTAASATFLATYRSFWERAGSGDSTPRQEAYHEAFELMAGGLEEHILPVYRAAAEQRSEELTGFLRDWADHCIELRSRLAEIAAQGKLRFPVGEDGAMQAVDLDTGLIALLSAYLHMTNNRLGVSMIDECYLAYLLEVTLNDGEPAGFDGDVGIMFGGTGADR
ncbi:thiopeptide-type bacteriocin biosynthesis protein [Brachybacterium sp. DNPG3]